MTAQGIKKGRKYTAVLTGASEVFLRDGFEGAKVDDIAHAAGVSKATLYNYFPDKRLLFVEVFRCECQRQTGAALDVIDFDAPAAEVLAAAARHMIAFFLSDFGQGMFRICVAEADRFPELGAAFYETGPIRLHQEISDFLNLARARGELVIDDIALATDQFIELCKADLYLRRVFGVQTAFSTDEIVRVAEGAVSTFMARYGA
ncbi:TetR/AcrR family transcriptional repressor of mexJK operon [Rhodovulum iodosum]|uniref:TetR/AcrR family transcriptional repressor of mexJK operon n=1 Tax=Rhodovulum iodosum TaxID=68291 RepID=A0ABV3Y0M7_9RHOB|nr:TetR/AcrR family transcriptional regulator [Rhodovulum robiginosum]RSK38066.1 TetR/AcrR family transcriptional regulator [Rhodovulum robiginosum]